VVKAVHHTSHINIIDIAQSIARTVQPAIKSFDILPLGQCVVDLIPAAAEEKIFSIPCHLTTPLGGGGIDGLG